MTDNQYDIYEGAPGLDPEIEYEGIDDLLNYNNEETSAFPDEDYRSEYTPQDYIRKLFEETKNGELTIHYFPFFDQPYSFTYRMDWTKQDVEALVERYDSLIHALAHIGKVHNELEDEIKRKELLSSNELIIWNTYIKPFEVFDEAEPGVVDTLYFRAETETLEEEEYELLDHHYDWFVTNCRKRLPFNRWCPANLINRAQRYEKLIELKAPDCVVTHEGRFLAEEMVLYYHCKKKLVFDSLKFIAAQMSTYEMALKEIKSGKKRTHWMWFIFPQLRGLGISDMSQTYGIADLDEAKLYLAHNELGARLVEISSELLKLKESDPKVIFGDVDAMKLKSSMTLFSLVSEEDSVFHKVLQKFYKGQQDTKTIELLAAQEQ